MVGGQLGAGQHLGVVHDDGVTFGVARAGAVAVDAADELLHAGVLGHAAAHHIGGAAVAVQVHVEIRHRLLVAGGHDLLMHHQRRPCGQIAAGFADGVVNAGDLGGLHLHVGALAQMHDGGGVHHLLAPAVPLAVVLFHVAQAGVFVQPEGVDAVMLGVPAAAVVDAAARDDGHIAVRPDVEIVVHQILQPGAADDDRNVYALVFGARLDENVNARLVRLGDDVDVGGGAAPRQTAVGPDVVGPHRQRVQLGHFLQQILFDGVHYRTPSTLSVSTLQAAPAASALPSRPGSSSARGPIFSMPPFFTTTMVSAMFRIRS